MISIFSWGEWLPLSVLKCEHFLFHMLFITEALGENL